MKRRRSPSSNRASGEVKRFHRSEVRSMIQAEVLSAVKQTEAKMERLLEKVQQLECEPKYDFTIRKLEANVKKLKRRGDAAIEYIGRLGFRGKQENSQKQSQLATPVLKAKLDRPRSDSEEETMDTASHTVRNALSEIKKEPTSPSPISSATNTPSSPQHKKPVASIKKELLSPGKSAEYDEQEEVGHEAARVKVEPPHEDTDTEMVEDAFRPLPPTLFPSILSAEAASYNIPQELTLKLALIRTPPGLSVLWDIEDVDPAAPPMENYSVFMAVETSKGSGVFPDWKPLGAIQATPLPMCVMISKYKPGYRAGFAVVGKDKFGRYGPYSKIVPATIPEDTV